ncbi:MAG: ribosome maturation factor RimM [Spirochaetota bacterium]|jgi:16S rRNA processing protein RimM|nr:ribosome maturation factor RimM [Spirochaetota bacterium]
MTSIHKGFVALAKIGSAHGLAGDLRVRFFSDDPDACCRRSPFFLAPDPAAGQLVCVRRQHGKTMDVAHFQGVDTREAAEALNGQLLYQERSVFPPARDDEYYLADLIGLEVMRASDHSRIGTVTDIVANDVLGVCDAHTGTMRYLPFTNAALPDIDLAKGVILAEDMYLE